MFNEVNGGKRVWLDRSVLTSCTGPGEDFGEHGLDRLVLCKSVTVMPANLTLLSEMLPELLINLDDISTSLSSVSGRALEAHASFFRSPRPQKKT